ncbi:PAS domain-containing protein [Rhizobiaceae bacterium n13]|uniref:histidine kinase n=1 Tax=Ferirhizobium litorale TaxID=2927786 RepID=A0AAE3QIS0_9HYPH|nr:PAS domain-containing protein [Fererhizobium litorale]MDI7864272.1 PAS domain-containing protein [Fererhizobium litorale]MDI7924623.1 PAS domain-containing protein [Fererhizobium litorale]
MTQAVARAFWSGVPQVVGYRARQLDGTYLQAEYRAESSYPVGIEVAPMVQTPDEPWTIADTLGETLEAVRAAKVIEELHGAAFAFDASGKFTYATPVAQTSIAMTLEDLNRPLDGRSFIDGGDFGWKLGVHPEDYGAAADHLRRCMITGEHFNHEYRVLRATGQYVWHRFAIRPTGDDRGRITGWYGIGFDIDVYKKTEEALRERERQLQQIIEALPALVYCALPDGKPIYRSQKLKEYLGFGLEDMDEPERSRLEGTLDAVVHPDDLSSVKEGYAHALSTGEPYARKHRLRRYDGTYRWVETRAEAMRNDAGEIIQWNGICLDVEDQVRSREELRLAQENLSRASQAASLAELSASIAHEIGQPLAALVSSSDVCDRWLSIEPPNIERARVAMKRVVVSAHAATDVVSRIRALFKHSEDVRSPTPLGNVIDEVVSLTGDDASRRGVHMIVDIENGLPLIDIDRIQIQQVLTNLVRNGMESMDAISGRKILHVRARRVEHVLQTEVADHGPGVDLPDRIFEPFFTTKKQGMGMGLAICRSIVESHGGRLWMEKNEPQGAKFLFTLPVEPIETRRPDSKADRQA